MKQYPTSQEVDFVVIGSGAAGGIMAKQLSTAGFSVVVLEQGGWGKYGREHEYNKDEWLARNVSEEDRLMSDPSRQRNTFRHNDNGKSHARKPQLWLRCGRRHRHLRRQQLAPHALGV
jgi:choline dehydrogenase-like flavoprotein